MPVRTVPGDAAVTGVAMLAGLGAGVYRDPAEAVERCVRLGAAGRAGSGDAARLTRTPYERLPGAGSIGRDRRVRSVVNAASTGG